MARICWGRSKVVLFKVLYFKWSVKKHSVAKIFQGIWDKFSDKNNLKYNSYKFSFAFKFTFTHLQPNRRIKFSASWWSGNEVYFCFLFVTSRALLHRYVEFKFNKRIFLRVIPARIIVPWFKQQWINRKISINAKLVICATNSLTEFYMARNLFFIR